MNILWDFDGTLCNTYPAYTKIFKEVLGGEILEEEIYKQLKISFSTAINYYNPTKQQLNAIKEKIMAISPEDAPPFPDVEDVLKFAEKNVIMTHKKRAELDIIIDHYGWNDYFAEIVTIDDGYPRKPHPASYEYLHNKHKLDLIIGDRLLDILPGKQLGIKTCLFQNKQTGADYYLDEYSGFFDMEW
ncbi:HAD-IA family hydrolase [Oceanobacillus salinisoli]|uniref:HAD-IA family hydrolase n=1 Tax=Oceanobacillus salinisoli TaxID=2678611 RepID=UPI0012E20ECF|nr:HAD-IA family hydrolase [Oceanobacillus salinisoli]